MGLNGLDSDFFYRDLQFQCFFKSSSQSLILKANAPDFTILAVSDNYLQLINKQREEIINRNFLEAFPGGPGEFNEAINIHRSLLRVIESGRIDTQPLIAEERINPESRKSETLYWSQTNQPIHNETGTAAYIVHTLLARNGDLKQTHESLQLLNEKLEARVQELEEVADSLNLALESANMGTWRADIVNDIASMSDHARNIHGIPAEASLTFTDLKELIAINDRGKTVLAIQHAVKAKEKFEVEYLINPMNGGSQKWLRSTGKAFYDQVGNPLYILGTIVDITSERNNEETLKYRKALLEAQNEAIPDALLTVDGKGQMLSYNHHFVDLWKIPQDIIERKDDAAALEFAMTQIVDPQGFIDRVNYCYTHPNESAHEEVLFKDGRIIERFGTSVTSEDGTSYGWAWYFRDVTKQRKLQTQKDEFISTVSHELKTPVTSIKAYAQLLHRSLAAGQNPDIQKRFLERMNIQIVQFESLIKDLLDISRIEAGKFNLNEDEFDIGEMLKELISDLQIITNSHTLTITENYPVTIKADKNRIMQVITNLVTNAVKYSPENDTIQICSRLNGNSLIFSVTDFGIGIAEHQKQFLFERFHQIERSNTGTGFNLGLGLYISKEIISRAGGEIWIESEVGEGSTFYFSLPLL